MSQYVYRDLGYQQRGARVEATLSGNAANVFLVDSSNYSNYRAGRSYRYTLLLAIEQHQGLIPVRQSRGEDSGSPD
jgi:Domain of unknown function (DUF1883)